MLGSRAWENYRIGQDLSHDDIRVAFKIQRELAERKMVVEQSLGSEAVEAWREVLLDYSLPLSALFRYCLAKSLVREGNERFESVAEEFRVAAALQYLRNPRSYDEIWGPDWIPDDFTQQARKVYERRYGKE
jgi:hypothetical protein